MISTRPPIFYILGLSLLSSAFMVELAEGVEAAGTSASEARLEGAMRELMGTLEEQPSVQKDPKLLAAVKSNNMLGSLMSAITGKANKDDRHTKDVLFLVNVLMIVVGKSPAGLKGLVNSLQQEKKESAILEIGSSGLAEQKHEIAHERKHEEAQLEAHEESSSKLQKALSGLNMLLGNGGVSKDLETKAEEHLEEQASQHEKKKKKKKATKKPMVDTAKKQKQKSKEELEAENARLKKLLNEVESIASA